MKSSDPVQNLFLGGSPRGNRQKGSHPLISVRALSRPGNNGGAYLGGSQNGYQQEESHSLKSARASSRPGNNGEASDLGVPERDYEVSQDKNSSALSSYYDGLHKRNKATEVMRRNDRAFMC